jgi:hypothetical protein
MEARGQRRGFLILIGRREVNRGGWIRVGFECLIQTVDSNPFNPTDKKIQLTSMQVSCMLPTLKYHNYI